MLRKASSYQQLSEGSRQLEYLHKHWCSTIPTHLPATPLNFEMLARMDAVLVVSSSSAEAPAIPVLQARGLFGLL